MKSKLRYSYIESLTKKELLELKSTLISKDRIMKLKSDIDLKLAEIEENEIAEKNSWNARFTIDMISTLSPQEVKLLKDNKIENIADLRLANISKITNGNQVLTESLTWTRDFYDMTEVEKKFKLKEKGKVKRIIKK